MNGTSVSNGTRLSPDKHFPTKFREFSVFSSVVNGKRPKFPGKGRKGILPNSSVKSCIATSTRTVSATSVSDVPNTVEEEIYTSKWGLQKV